MFLIRLLYVDDKVGSHICLLLFYGVIIKEFRREKSIHWY